MSTPTVDRILVALKATVDRNLVAPKIYVVNSDS